MNANDKPGLKDPNSIIYDVKSFKSYFFMGDYIITIGAGISNLNTPLDGEILLNAKIRASKWKELNPNNKKKENLCFIQMITQQFSRVFSITQKRL